MPVLGGRREQAQPGGEGRAFCSALWIDGRFPHRLADPELTGLCSLCCCRPSTLWRLNADNCFKESPRLLVHLCLLGLWERKSSPLRSPPAAASSGFSTCYWPPVFPAAASMSQHYRRTSRFAGELQSTSARSTELLRSSSFPCCRFTSLFTPASNI